MAEDSASGLSAEMQQFESEIRPLLVNHCIKCHGEHKQEGGLRLDSREAMLRGGDSGPAIVPADAGQSLLISAVRYESFEMPPTGQLNSSSLQALEQWVERGAAWPEHAAPIRAGAISITEDDRAWWAFQPVQPGPVPELQNDNWSASPVDRFVLQQLQAHGLTPAPAADPRTLVRRLYFDLVGLPPTPEESRQFLTVAADSGVEAAREQLVERLLADVRYGEHWARFWLDVVRYAESDGWNQDAYRPHIWRYRDYVINAFHTDKPWPDFVREQLAGDETGQDNPEHLAAAGYLRLGIYEYNQRDARGLWNDVVNEVTDVTGDAFLGLSMGCARCHDHKFDPILQADYFRLRAFLEPVIWRDDLVAATKGQQQAYEKELEPWNLATQAIRDQIADLIAPYHERKWKSTADKFPLDIQACFYKPVEERTSWEHQMAYLVSRQFEEEAGGPLKDMKKEDKAKYDELQKQLAAFDHMKPAPLPPVMTVSGFDGPASPTVIPDSPDSTPIQPGYLTVMVTADETSPADASSALTAGRRTELARWIGSGQNPLTMRVIVNRIWQQHFGQGLVATSSDFGRLGTPPSHPELLDWLVTEFVEHDFSIKHLHRLILASATWQQSAHHPDAARQQSLDPAENLLWRSRIRRLSAEQIRDAMLVCSGELLQRTGGPSVDTDIPRRAVYVKSFRNTPDPLMGAFDQANGLQSTSERVATTTPVQSLLMINGDYPLARAKQFAARIAEEYSTPDEQIAAAVEMAWGRRPSPRETAWSLQFLAPAPTPLDQNVAAASAGQGGEESQLTGGSEVPTRGAETARQRLTDFCHILLNSSEFLYVE